MANDYASDPRNVSSMNTPFTPQNGAGGAAPATPSLIQNSNRRLQPGVELSGARYKIERLVAAGGMGAVYRAIDTRFNRPCAVKEMLDEFHTEAERAQSVEWFTREATLLLDLNHPCIPRVRDFFVEYGKHYLVMDYIDGRTLGDVVEKEGNVLGVNGARGVAEARVRSWAQQVCSVLVYLHRQEPPIIFRDLKPSNIMVTTQDEVKLIDFGIARSLQGQGQQATVISTMGYAPPEQLLGDPEPRSDLYALGATLHKVLTRHDASNNKPNIFVFPLVHVLRPDVSLAFEQVVMKALAYKVDERWSSALEMERAIMNLPPVNIIPPTVVVSPGMQLGGANSQTPNSDASLLKNSGTPVTPPNPSLPASAPRPPTTTGPAAPHIAAAFSSLASGRIETAYQAVQQAHSLEPNNAVVHKIFGQVFARRVPPQPDLAQRAYERSLQLNSEDAETHKLLADVYLFLRQQPFQAMPIYIQSVRLNPKDAETHHRLGQCYERTNQLESAFRAYQEAAALAPKQNSFQVSLGYLALRMNQLPTAEHALVDVLIANPADHQTRFLLAQVYERENKLEDALRECNFVLGPLGAINPAVSQMLLRLRSRLGR